MTIRFDPASRQLKLSVRDVAFVDPGGGLGRESALPLSRVAMGRVAQGIHRERARLVARADGIEVPIRFETRVLDYDVEISGRIDALVDVDDSICVEEVKTVFRSGPRLPRDPAASGLENYRKQVLVYAFLVEEERRCAVTCRLALVSAFDGTCVELEVPYDANEIDSFLSARLERIIREYEEDQLRRERLREWRDALTFPFDDYRPSQRELIESVAESLEAKRPLLLSAPAGTGKTIGVLYPAIKHAIDQGKRIIFVTAKNTQSRMVQEMLERIGVEGSPLRAQFLRAKTEMCATGELVCHEDVCEYLRDLSWKLLTSGVTGSLFEQGIVLPDRIYAAASVLRACPFYTAMEMTSKADVIVGDYNYAFDPIASLGHLFESPAATRDHILIVDEAHNLPRRVMDAYSPSLSRKLLRAAWEDLDNPFEPTHAALRNLIERLSRMLDEIKNDLGGDRDDVAFEPDVERFLAFRDELERLLLRFLLSDESAPVRRGEDPVLGFFYTVAQFLRVLEMEDLPKVVYYRLRPDEGVRILNLDPSSIIRDRVRSFGGAVLMSATLAPIDFYRRSLGLDDEETLEVQFPSPFPPERRAILIDGSISTRYRDRGRAYPRVAALIQDLVACREGNYLCFFPSFRFLEEVVHRIDHSRLEVIEQRPAMGTETRTEILARLQEPTAGQPRAIFAVQGGIFSEGVDYPGGLCIGVVVVGPGLPGVGFENECIRKHYDEDRRGFEFAYLYPGMNRVIQSAGRLIRTELDEGVMVLVGQRFTTESYRECFPDEWRREGSGAAIADDVVEAARCFWAGRVEHSQNGITFSDIS